MASEFNLRPQTPQQQQQDFGPRMKNAVVVKPIVFGNVARSFGHKRTNGHTHEWKCYLRLYSNEDSSNYIKKVQFKLHDSYPNPLRIFNSPPYEVDETGWGEFEIVIKIYFADPAERPVTISHLLKLFRVDITPTGPVSVLADYIVSEFYDELIFAEPSATMYHLLQSAPQLPASISAEFDTNFEEKKAKTLESLLMAQKKIRAEIDDLKRRIEIAKDEVAKYKSEIASKHQGTVS